MASEDADFEARVKVMKEFMSSERFKHTTRPYKVERGASTARGANVVRVPVVFLRKWRDRTVPKTHTFMIICCVRNSTVLDVHCNPWVLAVAAAQTFGSCQVEDVVKLQGTFPMYFNGAKALRLHDYE